MSVGYSGMDVKTEWINMNLIGELKNVCVFLSILLFWLYQRNSVWFICLLCNNVHLIPLVFWMMLIFGSPHFIQNEIHMIIIYYPERCRFVEFKSNFDSLEWTQVMSNFSLDFGCWHSTSSQQITQWLSTENWWHWLKTYSPNVAFP